MTWIARAVRAGTRTYLNIPRGRDGDRFRPGLGATTAVYLMYTSGVATTSWTKSVPSH
jgi:hypothetical protein